jgi:hypothetical protein
VSKVERHRSRSIEIRPVARFGATRTCRALIVGPRLESMSELPEDLEGQQTLICDAFGALWAVEDAEVRELGSEVLGERAMALYDVLEQLEEANFRARMRALAAGILAE